MREETYIKRCRQRVLSTVEKRRKYVQLRKRRRDLNAKQKAQELDRQSEILDRGAQATDQSEANDVSDPDDLLVIPRDQRLWEKYLQADIEPYAQALCLSLAHAVLARLPRQIRDQIYSHVLELHKGKVTVCDGKLPLHLRSSCNSMHSHRSFWNIASLKHYLDPRFVGKEMAKEVGEAYYRSNTFYFDYHELYLIHKFLIVDRFGHNFMPAEHIRNIEIVLDENYRCSSNTSALFYYGVTSTDTATPADTIRWCLEQLFRLTTRSANITFIVYRNCAIRVRDERLIELLEIISPLAIQFKRLGHHVSLGLHTNFGLEWLNQWS